MNTNPNTPTSSTEQGNRDLLELTARAVGITISDWSKKLPSSDPVECTEIENSFWNSLAPHVEAIGLALRGGMEIRQGNGVVVVSSKDGWSSSVRLPVNPFDFLRYFIAVRRAIAAVADKAKDGLASSDSIQSVPA